MKLETFFEQFDLFADAPNAVGKMRELVLKLAVQGRLVEQNRFEEPAEALLQRVMGFRPDYRDYPNLPTGWKCIAVGELVSLQKGKKPSNLSTSGHGLPYLDIAALEGGKFRQFTDDEKCPRATETDLIIVCDGSRSGLVLDGANGVLGSTVSKVCFVGLERSYLRVFLASLYQDLNSAKKGAAIPHLDTPRFLSLPLPIPPLAEQKRIVDKVDQLMTLCDTLQAQQQERDARHAALARASLARFSEAPTPDNLDFLFHKSYAIAPADLRKSILTLAVQGGLTEQQDNFAVVSLNEACESIVDCPHSTPTFQSYGMVCIDTTCFKQGMLQLDRLRYVSDEVFHERNKRLYPRSGDIVFAREGSIGESVIIPDGVDACLGQRVMLLRPSNSILSSYLQMAISSPSFFEQISHHHKGVGAKHINVRDVRSATIPLPPIDEQRRIVAKVDQLMALVDQLESQLAEAKSKSAALLEAVVHELLNPSAEIIDLGSYRAAIGCYTIRKMSQQPYFGRTAAMKVLYLAEAHVGLNLGFQPKREAAGPLDPWIYRFEDEGKQKEWFKAVENTSNEKMKVEYRPGKTLAAQVARAERQLSQGQRKEFDRLLDLLSGKKTEEVEIIATLFAAWNDFLIDGHAPSDDEIVTEVRENWHERKERFTPALLRQWLGWLRQNNLVPRGRPPRTPHQPKLALN